MKRKTSYFKIILTIATVTLLMLAMCIFVSASEPAPADLRIAYCNLSFESDTHIMYAIKSNDANVKLLVWSEPQNAYTFGTQKTALAPFSEQMTINGELYTVFKYTGVAAKQMTDNVYVRACIDNGNGDVTYGDVHKYSILQYAYNKLGKTGEATTNEKLINLINATLEQGAAAQEYHNYKTDRLATDDFVQVKLTDGTLHDGFKHGLYLIGESVTITAPEQNADGTAFTQWKDKSGAVIGDTAEFILTVGSVNNTYTPEYVAFSAGLEFETNDDGTCYLIGIGDCTDTDIKIPAKSPDGDIVIGIDRNAFSGEATITSVSIPTSVEEIGRNAFNGCTALTDVYYDGSESDWALIDIATGNTVIEDATKHFAVVEAFTVTFVDYNGTVLKTETVNKGASATAPAVVNREGYSFDGWDVAFDNVTSNLTVTAQYKIIGAAVAINDVTANVGDDTVSVTISILNNPGISAIKLNVAYGESLTLQNVVFDSAYGAYVTAPSPYTNPQSITFISPLVEIDASGTFATLTFAISNAVTDGTEIDITVTVDQENTYDEDFVEVTFSTINGKVIITEN